MSAVCAVGAGLVHSSTSENGITQSVIKATTRAASGLLVDRPLTRLKKMRHGVLTAARLQGEQFVRQGRRYRAAMATLTYDSHGQRGEAGGSFWRPRHLSEYLDRSRKFAKKHGNFKLQYTWVAEMQKRGVVHYHVMFWLPFVTKYTKKGRAYQAPFKLPKPDSVDDAKGVHVPHWPNGWSEIAWARKAAGYLAKYTSKGQDVGDPPFPRGIRISGTGGHDAEGKRENRWWRAPSEARSTLGLAADIRRITGGRFDALTGLFWESPWVFLLIEGKPYIVPKGEILCA